MRNLCWKLGLITSLFMLLAGCGHKDVATAQLSQPSITKVSDEAGNQIAEAAASVSHSLTDLEAVEKANMAPRAAKLYPEVAQVSVPGYSSIDWNGPIEPLLKQIAQASQYRLVVHGSAPITPIIVTVHAQQDTNANIIRNTALQAGNRATVKADPSKKIIELNYLGR